MNDVASINIDAKLVRNDRNRARSDHVNTTADLADTIELANGCACECNWLQSRVACSMAYISLQIGSRTFADLLCLNLLDTCAASSKRRCCAIHNLLHQ